MDFKGEDLPRAGVITTGNYILASDGDQYRAFWCKEWLLVTDKEFPVPNFRSSERWEMMAMDGQKVLAVFPGCEVKGFVARDEPLKTSNCFSFLID